MSDRYVGQVLLVPYGFCPAGCVPCDGSLLPISQYDALFNAIGTTYGGDGQQTFAVPDLRGRVPIHRGQAPGLSAYSVGDTGGAEQVALVGAEVGPHTHLVSVNADAQTVSDDPTGRVPAPGGSYDATPDGTTMDPSAVVAAGGGQPHENRAPYLALSYCIAFDGAWPSQS